MKGVYDRAGMCRNLKWDSFVVLSNKLRIVFKLGLFLNNNQEQME